MKHVLMTLFLLAGLGMSMDAQTCTPSPNCPPACVKACLDKSPDGRKARKAALTACTPEQIEACKAAMATCTPEQIAACKAKCTPEQMAACKAAMADGGTATSPTAVTVSHQTPSSIGSATEAPACGKLSKSSGVVESEHKKERKAGTSKS